MAKRLCKMNRKQIADNLGDIHRLVVEPKFVCRSCARSSASQSSLCKPAAIPPQSCQEMPVEQQRACGLLTEALPKLASVESTADKKAQAVRRVVERVKQKAANEIQINTNLERTDSRVQAVEVYDKKALKSAKKALKKYYKQQQKLLKLAKKQQKLLKRQKKLEAHVSKPPPIIIPELVDVRVESQVH